MSVISFKEIHNGRDGVDELGSDGKKVTRYTRVFRAITDDNTDDAYVVGNHDDCPKILDAYPSDSWATCRRVRPRNESFSKTVWLVPCAYSTAPLTSDEIEWEANPLNERTKITWNDQQYTRPYFQDKDGNAIVNAARRYFDPPVDGDDARLAVTVRKNVWGVPSWFLTFRNAINSSPFRVDGLLVATRCAKMAGFGLGEVQERNGVPFRVLRFTLHLDEDTWIKKILNDGYYTLDGNPCVDEQQNPVTEPAMLAADGTQLANPVALASINFIDASIYKEKNFNLLPLS